MYEHRWFWEDKPKGTVLTAEAIRTEFKRLYDHISTDQILEDQRQSRKQMEAEFKALNDKYNGKEPTSK